MKQKPEIRFLKDMHEMLYDQDWAGKTNPDSELYYIYRGKKEKGDLRYDITIIPPQMLGKEYVKTKGHSHPEEETFEVLTGEVIFLLQKIPKVKIIKAKKGDKIKIPSNWGHVAINPSKTKTLKLANWLKKTAKGNYNLFVKNKGACYFYTEDGWIKNRNYAEVVKLENTHGPGPCAFKA